MKKGLILLTLMTVIGGTMLGAAGPARPPKPPYPGALAPIAAPAEMVTFTIEPATGTGNTLTVVIDKNATWEDFFTAVCKKLNQHPDSVLLNITEKPNPMVCRPIKPSDTSYSIKRAPTNWQLNWQMVKFYPISYCLTYVILTPEEIEKEKERAAQELLKAETNRKEEILQKAELPQNMIALRLISIADEVEKPTTAAPQLIELAKTIREIADEIKTTFKDYGHSHKSPYGL